nr:MAG TPA: hypothetical protein [Caudoviricetes sp.]
MRYNYIRKGGEIVKDKEQKGDKNEKDDTS